MTINAFPIPTINAAEFNPQSYGWLPDGINHSTEMQALLNAVVAAGGGTIRFPAAAGRYRCDAQLFIPNDATATPNQVNIRIVGSGGGPIWDNNARTTVNAVVLDLRYTASDGNAKIETRGYGGLVIENLTLIDGGTANNTPFIHTSSTTLVIRGNTFIGSGSTAQDGIVCGGASSQLADGSVTACFQGYGTIIDSNSFRKLNRAVFGRTFANSLVVTNNIWLDSTGTIGMEFAATTGVGSDIITGLIVSGNIIEMRTPMVYGIVLQGVLNSYFCNAFYDASVGTYVSDYKLVLGSNPSGYTQMNVFVKTLSGGVMFTQVGSAQQLSLQTIIAADGGSNPFNDGIASTFITRGAEIDGYWQPANAAAGALNVRDIFNPNGLLCFGMDGANGIGYIDAWSSSSGGYNQILTLQPRGGPVIVNRTLAIGPTALTLVNGLNSNIALWGATAAAAKSSYIRITGPSAAFSVGGFSNLVSGASSTPGSKLILYNSTAQQMTLVNADASSSAANRIKTLTGANVVLRAGTSSATLIYDATDTAWILIATN